MAVSGHGLWLGEEERRWLEEGEQPWVSHYSFPYSCIFHSLPVLHQGLEGLQPVLHLDRGDHEEEHGEGHEELGEGVSGNSEVTKFSL